MPSLMRILDHEDAAEDDRAADHGQSIYGFVKEKQRRDEGDERLEVEQGGDARELDFLDGAVPEEVAEPRTGNAEEEDRQPAGERYVRELAPAGAGDEERREHNGAEQHRSGGGVP